MYAKFMNLAVAVLLAGVAQAGPYGYKSSSSAAAAPYYSSSSAAAAAPYYSTGYAQPTGVYSSVYYGDESPVPTDYKGPVTTYAKCVTHEQAVTQTKTVPCSPYYNGKSTVYSTPTTYVQTHYATETVYVTQGCDMHGHCYEAAKPTYAPSSYASPEQPHSYASPEQPASSAYPHAESPEQPSMGYKCPYATTVIVTEKPVTTTVYATVTEKAPIYIVVPEYTGSATAYAVPAYSGAPVPHEYASPQEHASPEHSMYPVHKEYPVYHHQAPEHPSVSSYGSSVPCTSSSVYQAPVAPTAYPSPSSSSYAAPVAPSSYPAPAYPSPYPSAYPSASAAPEAPTYY